MSVAQVEMPIGPPYSADFKASVILPVLRGERGAMDAAREAGVSGVTVYQWIKDARENPNPPPPKEPMTSGTIPRQRTPEERAEILAPILRGEIKVEEQAKKVGIHPQTLYAWKSRAKKAQGGKPSMVHRPDDEKATVIAPVLAGKMTAYARSKELGMSPSPSMIKRWVAAVQNKPKPYAGKGTVASDGRKYRTDEEKAEIMAPVLAKTMTAVARADELGISRSMLQKWVDKAKKNPKQRTAKPSKVVPASAGRYTPEFKAQAIAPIQRGEMTIKRRAAELGIPVGTVNTWWYRAKASGGNGARYGLDKEKGHALVRRSPAQMTLLSPDSGSVQARCNALAQVLVALDGMDDQSKLWILKTAASAASGM